MVVVDASAVVDMAIDRGADDRLADRLAYEDELLAPHLIDLEVLSAVRRLVRVGDVNFDRAADALVDFSDFAISRFPHQPFLERIWDLRDNLSTYDAAYLSLAEATSVPLITCDAGLAAVAERSVDVELFPSELN